MNKEEIIELVQDCKLVQTGYESNGHDCWGNLESTSYQYVMINGKKQKCWDDWYIIHDGKNVFEVITKSGLETRKFLFESEQKRKEHFEKTGFDTPREYTAYLKGKNEKND